MAQSLKRHSPEEVTAADKIVFQSDLKIRLELLNFLPLEAAILTISLPEFIAEAAEDVVYRNSNGLGDELCYQFAEGGNSKEEIAIVGFAMNSCFTLMTYDRTLRIRSLEVGRPMKEGDNDVKDNILLSMVNRLLTSIELDKWVALEIEVLKRWNIIDQQEFYASYFNATDNQSSIMVQKVVTKTPNLNIFSSGSLKTYRWTLSIVPVFANWIEAEREAALSVDAEEAAKACAPDLVKMTVPSFGVVNGDEKSVPTGKEREIRLSKLNEILDIREFRHCVSSTDFLFLP
ncbi:hypothetical protein Aperf_G00000118800 [Anoplocephala perfoliata]